MSDPVIPEGHKKGESGKAELDGGFDLHEGLLERQDPAQLQGRGEHCDAHHVAVKVVQAGDRVQSDVSVATRLFDL